MKKNKKNKMCMTDVLTGIEIGSMLCELLDFEAKIDLKKKLGKKLTDKEYFFDTYMLKPSSIYRCLKKR